MTPPPDRRTGQAAVAKIIHVSMVADGIGRIRRSAAIHASLTGATAEQVLEQALAEERQHRRYPRPRSLTRAPSDARP
jgi:hypothetical protein